MIDPISIGLNKDYYVKKERDKEGNAIPGATKWIIGPIDSYEKAMILSSFSSENLSVEVQGDKKVLKKDLDKYSNSDFIIVSHGLKGFENFGNIIFRTEKKKLFDREIDVVPMDILKVIPLDIILELSEAIWSDNHVQEELKKN